MLGCLVVGGRAQDAPETAGEPAVREASRPWIVTRGGVRVIGADAISVQAVAALADQVASDLEGLTGWQWQGGRGDPEVHLVEAGDWSEAWPVSVAMSPDGTTVVRVRWADEVTRREAREAVVVAWVRAWWSRQPESTSLVPPVWLVRGLAYAVEVRAEPAWRDHAVRWAESEPWPELDDLVEGRPGEVPAPEACYSLWQALRAEAGGLGRWRERLAQSLPYAVDPWSLVAVLRTGGPELANPTEREELRRWWREAGQQAVGEMDGIYLTLLRSAAVTAQCAMVELADGAGSAPEQWFVAAADPAVRAALNVRVERIRAELGRIHPAWYNALLSLGRAAEAAVTGDAAAGVAAVRAWEMDRREAEQLSQQLRALVQ